MVRHINLGSSKRFDTGHHRCFIVYKDIPRGSSHFIRQNF